MNIYICIYIHIYISTGINFFEDSFSNRENIKKQNPRGETKPKHLIKRWIFFKNRPIHIHIDKTRFIGAIKWNKLSFSSIEINKPLPPPDHSFLQVRFKFKFGQLWLLPQIRRLITFGVVSNFFSIDINITDNISKVINAYRKRVVPRKKPWGKPALTGYSCKAFPSNTTWSQLLLRYDKASPYAPPEIPQDSSLWRRPAYQTISKALNISSATAQVALNLFKAHRILTDTTVRRSAVELEDLKTYWKSEKGHISQSNHHKFLKDSTNYRKRTNKEVVFSCRPLLNILKHRTRGETFQESEIPDSNNLEIKIQLKRFENFLHR